MDADRIAKIHIYVIRTTFLNEHNDVIIICTFLSAYMMVWSTGPLYIWRWQVRASSYNSNKLTN